jgi:phospholipid transport system substrate-binding protein
MQRLRKTMASALLGLLVTAVPFAALAGPAEDARDALRINIDEVAAILRDRPPQGNLVTVLEKLADIHFAFETTTRLAVGPGWRDFTPEQRARATALFSRLVIRTYSTRLSGTPPPEVSFDPPAELRADRVEVPARVLSDGRTYAVTYRLEFDKTRNLWRIYDLVAEGVSLVSNYRSQFDPIVRRNGPQGLLSALDKRLATVQNP